MKRECPVCGSEYDIGQVQFDPGFCAKCKPGFFSKPLWFIPTEAGTRSVWQFVVAIHIFYILLFPLIMDCGVFSIPASLYSLIVLVCFAVRFAIAKFRKYPILTKIQTLGLLLLPLYGLAGFVTLFHWIQKLRYNL